MNINLRLGGAVLLLGGGGVGLLLWGNTNSLHSTFYGDLRGVVFPAGDIQLNSIVAGSTHFVEFDIVNPLEDRVYFFDLQRSCGCIDSSFSGRFVDPGATVHITASISPKKERGAFTERMWLVAGNPKLDGLGITISGTVGHSIRLIDPAQFPDLHSEVGGEAGFSFLIEETLEWDSLFGDDLALLFEVASAEPVCPFALIEDSLDFVRTTSGQWIVKGKVRAASSSLWGPIKESYLMFAIPPALGAGQYPVPITGAFVPDIKVVPGNYFDSEGWAVDAIHPLRILLQLERSKTDPVAFPERSGGALGLSWEVAQTGSDWEVRLLGEINRSELPSSIAIPYEVNGNRRHVQLEFR